jgi:hypothetical protein
MLSHTQTRITNIQTRINSIPILRDIDEALQPIHIQQDRWERDAIWINEPAAMLRADGDRNIFAPAIWSLADEPYANSAWLAQVRRGLLPATAIYARSNRTHPGRANVFRVGEHSAHCPLFAMLGCYFIIGERGAEFGLLSVGAGEGFPPEFGLAPLVVPKSHWVEWLNPRSVDPLDLSGQPGTFNLLLA